MSRRPALSSASNVGRPSARSASMDTIDFHIPQIINVRPTRHHATSSIVAQRSMSPDGYGTRPYSTDDESVDDSDASSGAGIIKVRNDDVDAIIAKVREYMETLDPDCVDSGNKGPARRDQLPEGVSAVLDPTNGQSLKNVTIELEMPVRDDLEEPIEEFSRLWRLGRFKDAEHYFAANLADHIHNESVRIPYGEMLLARGDYGAFARTREKEALGYASWGGSQHSEGKPFPFLQLLWGFRDLTKIFDYSDNRLFGSMDGRLTSIHDLDDKFAELPVPEWALLVNKKLLPYYLKLAQGSKFSLESFGECISQIHWRGIYEAIHSDGRIWELRDTISLMSHILPHAEDISARLFGTSNIDTMFSKLLDDWRLEPYDEASELALLDIYVTLLHKIHLEHSRKNDLSAANCLAATQQLAGHIMRNDPESMRSRPFLRYALSQVSLQIYEARHDRLATTPGCMMWVGDPDEFQLEVSIPRPDGPIVSPDFWHIKDVSVNTLAVILNGARELGDYRLEAECLKHLALAVEEPRQHLDDLARLQRDVQHDEEGHLHTLLASNSLLPVTPESWERVLSNFLVFDKLPKESGMEISPTLLWAKAMITSQLVRHSRPDDSWKEETKRLAPYLQVSIIQFVEDRLGLDLTGASALTPTSPLGETNKNIRQVQERYIKQLETKLGINSAVIEREQQAERSLERRLDEVMERARRYNRRGKSRSRGWEGIERRPKTAYAQPPRPAVTTFKKSAVEVEDEDPAWPITLISPQTRGASDDHAVSKGVKGRLYPPIQEKIENSKGQKAPSITWKDQTVDGQKVDVKAQPSETLPSVDKVDEPAGGQSVEPSSDNGPTVEIID